MPQIKANSFKYLLLSFILFALFSCSVKKKQENGWTLMNLKGKVKSVTYLTYKTNKKTGDIYKDSLTLKSIVNFDEKGNRTEELSYKQGDKLTYQHACKYDDKNNIIEETRTEPSPFDTGANKGGTITIKFMYQYKYDATGHIEQMKVFEDAKQWFYDTYVYDAGGLKTEQKHYQPGDTLNKTESYKYDEQGNVIEQSWSNGNGEMIGKYVNTYDEHGNLTETSFYNQQGKLNWKEAREYDEYGNKTKDINYGKDGKMTYETTIKYSNFDKEGNWQQCVYINSQNESESGVVRTIEYYQ